MQSCAPISRPHCFPNEHPLGIPDDHSEATDIALRYRQLFWPEDGFFLADCIKFLGYVIFQRGLKLLAITIKAERKSTTPKSTDGSVILPKPLYCLPTNSDNSLRKGALSSLKFEKYQRETCSDVTQNKILMGDLKRIPIFSAVSCSWTMNVK